MIEDLRDGIGETPDDLRQIKLRFIDFGSAQIVLNRFETYKDYYDIINGELMFKFWYETDLPYIYKGVFYISMIHLIEF